MGEWQSLIGAFMMNSGHAEISTYKWLSWISPEKLEVAKGKDFENRMGYLYGFVKDHIQDEQHKADFRKLLGRMKSIYSLRSVIAHNPVAMKQLPDGTWQMMIPNIMDLTNSNVVPALLKEDLARFVQDLVICIVGLEGLFIGAIRDRDGVEPNQ
jgi:hypothetical protein